MVYDVFNNCISWLKETHFDNFVVEKLFVREKEKEIIVISNIINDNVLDEFYNKAFDYVYKKDSDVVFMITTERDINYSAMPIYDKKIEILNN